MNPTIDAGLYLPLVFISFNGVSFEGVVDGRNVSPLEPRLPTLDGRDGGLTMGARVAGIEIPRVSLRLFAISPTLNDRPCTPDMTLVVAGRVYRKVWNPKSQDNDEVR